MRLPFVLAAGILAVAAAVSSGAAAEDARHVALYYIVEGGPTAYPVTDATVRPLIAYHGADGEPRDWLFDGIILYSASLYHASTTTPVDAYYDLVFTDGQLSTLASTVADLRVALGDPDYQLKVYLSLPYREGDSNAAMTGRLQTYIDSFAGLGASELELAGFYEGYWEDYFAATAPSSAFMVAAGSYLAQRGLRFVDIPGWPWDSPSPMAAYGFDFAAQQPRFNENTVTIDRFRVADDQVHDFGLSGVELEFQPTSNGYLTSLPNPELTSGLAYLAAMDRYNWTEQPWNAYYHGHRIGHYAASTDELHTLYDRMYRVVAAHPRRSVAPHVTIGAEADAHVEQWAAHASQNFGAEPQLVLGTNTAPNALRAYLRFPLAAIPAHAQILAAHLRLQLTDFVVGEDLTTAELFAVDAPWEEAAITWQNQPDDAALTLVGPHRFRHASSYPQRHSLDVTDALVQALGASDPSISFCLRRNPEDGVASEVTLASREAGTATGPVLEIVYLPTDAPLGGAGGAAGAAGSGGDAAGGSTNAGGEGAGVSGDSGGATSAPPTGEDAGCGCRASTTRRQQQPGLFGALLLLGLALRRRRACTHKKNSVAALVGGEGLGRDADDEHRNGTFRGTSGSRLSVGAFASFGPMLHIGIPIGCVGPGARRNANLKFGRATVR